MDRSQFESCLEVVFRLVGAEIVAGLIFGQDDRVGVKAGETKVGRAETVEIYFGESQPAIELSSDGVLRKDAHIGKREKRRERISKVEKDRVGVEGLDFEIFESGGKGAVVAGVFG